MDCDVCPFHAVHFLIERYNMASSNNKTYKASMTQLLVYLLTGIHRSILKIIELVKKACMPKDINRNVKTSQYVLQAVGSRTHWYVPH